MMRRLLAAGCLLSLAACDIPGVGAGAGDPRQGDGPATDLVESMAARGRLPQRDYVCVLAGAGEDQPYGTLGVAADRFTLILKGGGRREGGLEVAENRSIQADGEIAVIGGEARRVTRARVNSEGETVELAFDFAPAEGGHDQVVCTSEA